MKEVILRKRKKPKRIKGILWPNFKEVGGKNRENEISVLVRGSDINLSVSAAGRRIPLNFLPLYAIL